MKRWSNFGRGFGAAFALVLLGFIVARAASVLPLPGTNGPSLGDTITNLYSVTQALENNTFSNYYSITTVSTTLTQAGCTQLNTGMTFLTATLGGTGAVCLPTARPAADVYIANNTGQTVDVFSSATAWSTAQNDAINGTTGTTAYTGMTNGKSAECFAPAGGSWWCVSGN
jgi:hypothetical protein